VQSAFLLSHEPNERSSRRTAYLWRLATVSLVYVLLVLLGINRPASSVVAHGTIEIAHVPRGTGITDGDAVRTSQDFHATDSKADQVQVSSPASSGPALAALVCVLAAAILAFFPAAPTRAFFGTVEAVLGVGRWHRTVVLHL
jgi:hypothetical protein